MGIHIGDNYAAVTQLGECKTEDLEVAGSSPARGTIHFFGSYGIKRSKAGIWILSSWTSTIPT